MASYPTSVKTFTAKVDGAGNTIMAAHINDLQDEVNALEAGLLQGTAPVNSSASTHASLSVTGGSTFAGPVTIPSTGAVCARLGAGATDVADAGVTALNFSTQVLLQRMTHSTATNSSLLTVDVPGVYAVGAEVTWSNSSAGSYHLRILRDATIIAYSVLGGLDGGFQQSVATVAAISSGQALRASVYQNSGSTRSLSAYGAEYGAVLWAAKVGV